MVVAGLYRKGAPFANSAGGFSHATPTQSLQTTPSIPSLPSLFAPNNLLRPSLLHVKLSVSRVSEHGGSK